MKKAWEGKEESRSRSSKRVRRSLIVGGERTWNEGQCGMMSVGSLGVMWLGYV